MNIIPLPYVKVFTNKAGDIETLCNLNNAPKLECEVLAALLANPPNTPNQNISLVSSNETGSITEVLTEDEQALELYTSPINAEFRLYKDFKGKFCCQWPKGRHSKIIEMAIMRKAVKALDNAINRLFYKNS